MVSAQSDPTSFQPIHVLRVDFGLSPPPSHCACRSSLALVVGPKLCSDAQIAWGKYIQIVLKISKVIVNHPQIYHQRVVYTPSRYGWFMIALRTLHGLWPPNGRNIWSILGSSYVAYETRDWNGLKPRILVAINIGMTCPGAPGALILVFSSNESISDRSWMFLSNVLDFPNSQSFMVLSFSTSHSLQIGISPIWKSCSRR